MLNSKQLGQQGEAFVTQYLKRQGFSTILHNYYKKTGEIDIIAISSSLIAFVEVKMRKDNYMDLAEVIRPSKIKKIMKVAKEFIARNSYAYNKSYRFDVALVYDNAGKFELTYIPHAFEHEETYAQTYY